VVLLWNACPELLQLCQCVELHLQLQFMVKASSSEATGKSKQ
jgi:hypothetical protein